MTGFLDIRTLYEAYLEKAMDVELKHNPADGIFGFGRKTSDDPCHEKFAEDLKAALKDFAAGEPDSGEVREVLAFIYRAPIEHPQPLCSFWMLNAAHGFTKDLIPRLSREDAAVLRKQYGGDYKFWNRLPAQQELFAALKLAEKK